MLLSKNNSVILEILSNYFVLSKLALKLYQKFMNFMVNFCANYLFKAGEIMFDQHLEIRINNFNQNQKNKKQLIYRGHVIKANKIQEGSQVFAIMTGRDRKEIITAKTIATAYIEGYKTPFLIVAPENYVCYKPEIIYRLKSILSNKILRLDCLNEKSCGCVIFYGKKSSRKVLLIKNKRSKNWSFPKGHIELRETEKETAQREVLEETGLCVKILEGFREVVSYWLSMKIKKTVILFAAESETEKVNIQQEEIKNFKWALYEEALKSLKHPNDLRVFKKAKRYIDRFISNA